MVAESKTTDSASNYFTLHYILCVKIVWCGEAPPVFFGTLIGLCMYLTVNCDCDSSPVLIPHERM